MLQAGLYIEDVETRREGSGRRVAYICFHHLPTSRSTFVSYTTYESSLPFVRSLRNTVACVYRACYKYRCLCTPLTRILPLIMRASPRPPNGYVFWISLSHPTEGRAVFSHLPVYLSVALHETRGSHYQRRSSKTVNLVKK